MHRVSSSRLSRSFFLSDSTSSQQLDFQYNAQGDKDILYEITEVYNTTSSWNDNTFQYSFEGKISNGLVDARPSNHLSLLSIQMLLLKGFVWSGCDQVTVLVTSNAWQDPKAMVFTQTEESNQKTLNIRADTSGLKAFKRSYEIVYSHRDRIVHQTDLRPLPTGSITIPDLFASHVIVHLYPALGDGISRVSLIVQYISEDGVYNYESEPVVIEADDGMKEVIIPTKKYFDPGNMNDFHFTYTVRSSKGTFQKQGQGVYVFVTGLDDE